MNAKVDDVVLDIATDDLVASEASYRYDLVCHRNPILNIEVLED